MSRSISPWLLKILSAFRNSISFGLITNLSILIFLDFVNVWSIVGEGSGIISLMMIIWWYKISILLNEILLSSLFHPEWHGVCVEHDWRRTRYLFIYFLKISLMFTNLYHYLFDVYRLFGGIEISILLNEILLSSLLHPE